MAVEIMRKETGLADSLGYVFFVRTAELFSMVASALVIASNVWMCVLLFPAVQSV